MSIHCLNFSAVAVQCLETAFEVSTEDQSLAVTQTLPEIFASATPKVDRLDYFQELPFRLLLKCEHSRLDIEGRVGLLRCTFCHNC